MLNGNGSWKVRQVAKWFAKQLLNIMNDPAGILIFLEKWFDIAQYPWHHGDLELCFYFPFSLWELSPRSWSWQPRQVVVGRERFADKLREIWCSWWIHISIWDILWWLPGLGCEADSYTLRCAYALSQPLKRSWFWCGWFDLVPLGHHFSPTRISDVPVASYLRQRGGAVETVLLLVHSPS